MTFPVYEVIFYVYAAILLGAGVMVISARNPVHSILFLVLAFFASAVLWMMLQAEFLSLVLVFVYVGAVMTLFLFVVMMLNIDLTAIKECFVKYLPYGILIMLLLIGTMLLVVGSEDLPMAKAMPITRAADYSNTTAIGDLLFTHYLFAFEVAAFILLVAMISAITLAFHGRKPGTKSQTVAKQLKANKQDNLRIVDIKPEPADQ